MSVTEGEDVVLYEVADHIATITLNRPHRSNAISMPMLRQLAERLSHADLDTDVRAVILTGAGKAFCAGLDIKDAAAGSGIGGGGASTGRGVHFNTRDHPTIVMFEMDTPVIGAINGGTAGFGLDIALGCDIRIVASDAKIATGFAKRGVVPESGGTWYLPRLLGWAKAAEIGFLGRPLTGADAAELGLMNLAVPTDEVGPTAREWAAEIAANAPLAVQSMKRLFRHGQTEDFPSHVHHVLLQTMLLFQSSDFREGITSFVEGTRPVVHGPLTRERSRPDHDRARRQTPPSPAADPDRRPIPTGAPRPVDIARILITARRSACPRHRTSGSATSTRPSTPTPTRRPPRS
jgi:enoyl-CoA hydratase/carnithine racemase